jgi:hypothetical protein
MFTNILLRMPDTPCKESYLVYKGSDLLARLIKTLWQRLTN